MTYYTKTVVFTLALTGGCAFSALAQEEHYPTPESIPEVQNNQPKEAGMQLWETEQIEKQEVKKDSPVKKASETAVDTVDTPDKNNSVDKKTDDSVLSFNFLYYLIQKFKLSESVE